MLVNLHVYDVHIILLDINECLRTPCANNGTCTNTEGSFACNCTEGWTGNTCYEGNQGNGYNHDYMHVDKKVLKL